ncbi:MAG TPA: hypothetical protein VM576_12565 [Xanthomonadaceae bacterium]|nr:hypothetical protein [Xanthomonadaceae bacterium]
MAVARLLDPKQIPENLWDRSTEVLHIPEQIAAVYLGIVDARGIRGLLAGFDGGPIGGLSREETESHFVNRLDGSLARVQLALLDPRHELENTSDTLLLPLSGGSTCVADAPCGAGAGVLGLLSVVADLRRSDVLPRIPLDVKLVAADISSHARELGVEMLEALRPFLEEQAINVSVEWIEWDATNVASNTHFVRRTIVASDSCARKLLLIANFSGFLSLPGKRKEAHPQLGELFRYFATDDAAALWLEPDHNSATARGGVLDAFLKFAREKIARFARISEKLGGEKFGYLARARFRTLLRGGNARVGACVVPIDLGAQK